MASSVGISVSSSLGVLKEEARTVRWASEDHIREPLDVAKVSADVDKDFQCPICLQTIEDAFLTSCGHTFCYSCITTHLDIRSNCPSCARYLTSEQLIPNFLFSKVKLLNLLYFH